MAGPMSTAFTTTTGRRRIATYGKKSRSLVGPAWNEDAPSPERPRKQPGAVTVKSQRTVATVASRDAGAGQRSSQPARDIFNVPSEDELNGPGPSKATVKKVDPRQPAPADVFDIPSDDDDNVLPQRRRGKTPRSLLRKPASLRKPGPETLLSRGDEGIDLTSSDDPIVPTRRRAKTPQVLSKPDKGCKCPEEMRPLGRSRTTSRATTPTTRPLATVKKVRATPKLPVIKQWKHSADMDIFDVPSSGDEGPLPTPKKNKPLPIPRSRVLAGTENIRTQLSPVSNESDDSNSSKKRKRSEQSDEMTVNHPHADNISADCNVEPAAAPRRKKVQRKEGNLDFLDRVDLPSEARKHDAPVNNPRRTRLRTAPGPPRPAVAKNQSAPVHLLEMLPVRPSPKFPPAVDTQQLDDVDEVSMYNVTYSTPKPIKSMGSGAVTPQQREMFTNLLGDSSETTTIEMPSIRKLQLTDRKPGLTRSSSDIPQSTHTRKTRLIDALVTAASERDSESDETDEDTISTPMERKPTPDKLGNDAVADVKDAAPDEMDIDSADVPQSQGPQSALHTNIGARVTYAKQRSYREDSNLEEGLLLGMDLDGPLGLGGFGTHQGHDSLSEDDDDPASQVRGIHELRKQAENEKFHMEAQTSIDDIADKAGLGKSLRRTAMMDLCTRIGDRKFLDPLLDSSLVSQFLANIGYTGEIIFDFAACVSIAFILEAQPDATVVEEVFESGVMGSLEKLLDYDVDISRIARERKTNMSKIGRESVKSFRNLVQMSSVWSSEKPAKVTPQLVALKTMESLVLALRKAGNTGDLVNEGLVCRLLDIVGPRCERLRVGKESSQDIMMISFAFSIMEASAVSREKPAAWSSSVLQRLADTISIFFAVKGASPIKLATRLCVLVTNNKPKACELFATQSFVEPLAKFINDMFKQLGTGVAEQETETREELILSLGALINIAEFSDTARLSMIASSDDLTGALVKTFLEGTERAAQADSLEDSQANIPIGYLTVLLGNLCLNDVVRHRIRSQLPGGRMDLLVEKVKEFVSFHERVDQMTEQFAGEEGRQMSQNYTRRLMQVVKKLEQARD